MTTGIVPVQFVYAEWIAAYPVFAAINPTQAQGFFDIACIYLRNDAGSRVPTAAQLKTLLYMLTAHVGWLSAMRDAQGNPSSSGTVAPPAIVGRLASASEGSVSVGVEYSSSVGQSQAWYIQTPFGAAFWAATGFLRSAMYYPGPVRPIVPVAPGSGPYG